jgi:LacI family transcriptional regulator
VTEKPNEQRRLPSGVTSRDLARLAGVSQATVSRVLNNSVNVSAPLRKRVMSALEQTGYRPNALAQAMKTGRTGTIGVVISRITNPFYPELLDTIGRQLAAADHRMVLWETTSPGGEASAVDAIHQSIIDGVIFTTALPGSRAVGEALRRDAPMVLVNRTLPEAQCDQVSSDNRGGAAKVSAFFSRAGHEHVGLIGGPTGASTADERREGFREGLGRSSQLSEAKGDFSHDLARNAALELLGAPSPPTAIFGVNDLTAFGVLDAAKRLGIQVPSDLWVVGFDDISMASWESFDLTTVRQPSSEMARWAVTRVLARAGGLADEPEHHRLPCELVVRGSTSSIAPDDVGQSRV